MHIYTQNSNRNYMKMNKNASVWTKLKFNFNFVHFSLVSMYRTPFIVFCADFCARGCYCRDILWIPNG